MIDAEVFGPRPKPADVTPALPRTKSDPRWLRWMGSWCAPLLFVLVLWQATPLGTAFGYYGNESFNVMKALLTVEGHGLYREVWSDQPPLFTFLLAGLFKLFGFSVQAARLLVLFFGALLVWAFYQCLRPKTGPLAAWAALALLIFAPNFLQLSVSAMIMIPSLALAMLAVWALLRCRESHRRGYLLLSGVCLALSLQTKMDTLLLIPAFVLELFLARRKASDTNYGYSSVELPSLLPHPNPLPLGEGTATEVRRHPESFTSHPARSASLPLPAGEGRGEGGRCPLPTSRIPEKFTRTWYGSPLFLWLGTVAGVFLLVAIALGWDAESLIGTHLSVKTRTAFQSTGSNASLGNMLTMEYGTNLLALAGVALVFWRKRWDLVFPVAWLATELIVRSWHRPFWHYHYLHLAVPLAWLAGLALKLGWDWLLSFELADFKKPPFKGAIVLLIFSLLLSLAAVELPDKARREWTLLHPTEPRSAWEVVRLLKAEKVRTRWVFTDNVMFPFHAGLPVPPEIAVLSTKRLQAGLITPAEILDVLRRYRPEQAVVCRGIFDKTIVAYLKEHYTLKLEDGGLRYYVLNEIAAVKPAKP